MFFYTSFVVHIRSFTLFQAFYKGWKNHYPVDSAIRPSYNRPQDTNIPQNLGIWKRYNVCAILKVKPCSAVEDLRPIYLTNVFLSKIHESYAI
jgi:hypothetical protein